MTNKQFNEIYRDFEGMSKSKTLSDIANWLDEHEEFSLINRDEISITFRFKERDLLVCITKGLSDTGRAIIISVCNTRKGVYYERKNKNN